MKEIRTETLTPTGIRQHYKVLNMDVEKDREITLPDKASHSVIYQVALRSIKHGCGKGP